MGTTKHLHDLTFPGETAEYRDARDRLLRSEMELRRKLEAVAEQRRQLPLGGELLRDYEFDAWSLEDDTALTLRFSDLFEDGKDTLFFYNFMFPENLASEAPCPSCTSIIDAVDGAAQHLVQRINFVAAAKAPIAKFRDHAKSRGWQHTLLLSSAGNTFKRDYHAEMPDGSQTPIASVFVRRGGKIHHFWSSELFWTSPEPGQDMRHVDFMWPMWHMLDTTPDGRGHDWGPALKYP